MSDWRWGYKPSGRREAQLRRSVPGLAVLILAACQASVDSPPLERPLAGNYIGDHGEMTRIKGWESELILDGNGAFRYFFVDSNTAIYTAKGKWSATGEEMVWTGVARSYLFHGGFRHWDTLRRPDTTYLRKVTDSGFERLEAAYDSLYNPELRWVGYRRFIPADALPEGTYEFSETYLDGVDTTRTIAGLTRLTIARDGAYAQQIFRDGILHMSDVDSLWTQAGMHLITTRNRHCDYEPDTTICGNSPPGYEYIARLADVADTGFRFWMSPDYTFQEKPFWAEFRKVTAGSR